MNHPLVRTLLGLDTIPVGAEDLRLVFEHAWPPWMWALLVIACAAAAIWSYTRLAGRRGMRGALAAVRGGILVLALVLLSGPMLELPRESVEPDWVMILADRSASMRIADAPSGDAADGAPRVSRDEQLASILRATAPTWAAMTEQRQVHWLGFHSGAFTLAPTSVPGAASAVPVPPATLPVDLGPATGDRTDLGAALEQALQRAAARPVSGVVVLSDGRSPEPPDRALLRRLQAEAIPVFVVPLGSAEPLGDLALRRVDAPRRAFIRDKVPVVVEIDRLGSGVRELGGTLRLTDDLTGETLDEITLAPGDEREQITLTAEPALAGEATWTVSIDGERADLVPENNSAPVTIELVDRPLRVLYIDGYPRWEYRYLKNLLVREKSIESSVMLLSADRDFAQEGNAPITRLPRSPEELARYDVVVLGDVPASFFSPDQLDMLREHVSERGAGMLWIAGERSLPSSYTGTALADLLPMRGALTLPAIGTPVNMRPTELADRLGILRLVTDGAVGWPEALTDPSYRWSQLTWAQRIEPGRLKPTAEVLAETTDPVDGTRLPLAMHLRFGAGKSIYVATDEIWRWRYGQGERLPEQFWIQMIRMLGRESLSSGGEGAVLTAAPRRLSAGQALRIDLRLLDQSLLDGRRGTVRAIVETEDGTRLSELELRPLPGAENRFAATWLPERPGRLRVRVDDPSFADLDLRMPVEVFAPDDELRRPETDHGALERLASATGGRVLAPGEIGTLSELLPNRAVRTLNPLRERIWDTPFVFALMLLLLTTEWIGRKLVRLV